MTKWGCILFGVLVLSYTANAYKILVLSPLRVGSHAILGEGMVKPLQKAGHEITYITGLSPAKPIPNVKVIEVTFDMGNDGEDSPFNLTRLMLKKKTVPEVIRMLMSLSDITKLAMTDEKVQALMKDRSQHFDVAIAEWLYSDIYSSFSAVFDCPFIWMSTMEPHWKILRLIDESTNPAYSVDALSSNVTPLTFKQRIEELGLRIMGYVMDSLYSHETEIYNKYVVPHIRSRGKPVPDIRALKYTASLVLGNSHVSLGTSNQLPDSYKHIGGYHIDREVKPLPEDLKKLFHSAEHGVIYFSMGSNIKLQTLPDKVKKTLMTVFGKLKQIVLWKLEDDIPNRPDNVHIVKWAPQQSVLAHEKCRIFITHGGLLSITEAVHFGVPIIGIPIFGDQFVNIARAVKKGFARKVELSHSMVEHLYEEINEIISNPSYTRKAKELSFIYHDRPVTPAAELVHWVEHVVKTRGAPHLRSPALMVPWYQKAYLDLVALIITFVVAIKYSVSYLRKSVRIKINSEKKLI